MACASVETNIIRKDIKIMVGLLLVVLPETSQLAENREVEFRCSRLHSIAQRVTHG